MHPSAGYLDEEVWNGTRILVRLSFLRAGRSHVYPALLLFKGANDARTTKAETRRIESRANRYLKVVAGSTAANSDPSRNVPRSESRAAAGSQQPKRGRPRQKPGNLKYKDFVRAGIVIGTYDELRQCDQKHSVAVREVAEIVRLRHPGMRISETGVRRILAAFRPKISRTVLRFERSALTEEEIAKYAGIEKSRWVHSQSQV